VSEAPEVGKWGYTVPHDLTKQYEGPLTATGCHDLLAQFASTIRATVPPPPTGKEVRATLERFMRPTHTAIVHPDRADRVREATRDVWPRVEVVESPHLPDADHLYLIDNKALEMPVGPFTWNSPKFDPLADMRAWARTAMSVPYQPFVPILSPSEAARLRRATKREEFRRKWRRRFADSRHLSPMRGAYWRRAKRRRRRG
jgi:hypothetical protein